MKKTLITIAAALALLLAAAGCAQNGAGTPPVGSTAPGGTQSAAPEGPQSAAPESSVPASAPAAPSKRDTIPFEEGQLYAVAYLGYQSIDDWDYYADRYLDTEDVPTHSVSISDGDYYLVIPRYDGMDMSLYVNDIKTGEQELYTEESSCGPFVVQCNVSDVFTDVTVRFTYKGETVEFSPFLSLENGALIPGERGLDISKPGSTDPGDGGERDPFIGEYMDTENGTTGLVIAMGEDGNYTVRIEIYRLAAFEDGVGIPAGPGLSFTATDPNGNPITGIIVMDETGDVATVTFLNSTWEYLPNDTSFVYTRG